MLMSKLKFDKNIQGFYGKESKSLNSNVQTLEGEEATKILKSGNSHFEKPKLV